MPPARSPDWLLRTTGLVAMAGGLLALAVASLVVVSVLGRWLADRPIEGDFELVKLGTAIAVFTFLPYTQARHGHGSIPSRAVFGRPRVTGSMVAGTSSWPR